MVSRYPFTFEFPFNAEIVTWPVVVVCVIVKVIILALFELSVRLLNKSKLKFCPLS